MENLFFCFSEHRTLVSHGQSEFPRQAVNLVVILICSEVKLLL
jgi:hypothetical protein